MKARQLTYQDLPQITEICKTKSNFTIPSNYVFWMLLRTNGSFCHGADVNGNIVAYILSMPTERQGEVFVWQFGIRNFGQNQRVIMDFFIYCKDQLKKHGIHRISFTAIEEDLPFLEKILMFSFGIKHPENGTDSFQFERTVENEYFINV